MSEKLEAKITRLKKRVDKLKEANKKLSADLAACCPDYLISITDDTNKHAIRASAVIHREQLKRKDPEKLIKRLLDEIEREIRDELN